MTEYSSIIEIDGLKITIVRSKRRTLGLEVGPLSVKARAPHTMPEKEIIAFVIQKQDWLNKHLSDLADTPTTTPLSLQQGSTLMLRGQAYTLVLNIGQRGTVQITRAS